MNKLSSQPASPSADKIAWQGAGWTVVLDLSGGVITHATLTWNNPAGDTAFLAALCGRLQGMGLREARDHGVQYALSPNSGQKVAGIVLPANYSVTSRAAEQVLRQAIDGVLSPDPAQWNFEDHGLSAAWTHLALDERLRRVDELTAAYLKAAGLSDAVSIVEIDQYDRVFVLFAPEFPVPAKPKALMDLEHHIRAATGERIELFVSEMKDNNRIRRL